LKLRNVAIIVVEGMQVH